MAPQRRATSPQHQARRLFHDSRCCSLCASCRSVPRGFVKTSTGTRGRLKRKMGEVDGGDLPQDLAEEEEASMEYSDGEGAGEEEDDDEDYEYSYADDDGDGDDVDVSRPSARPTNNVVFTGLDTIGCTNDMVLKKELMRIKTDVEKSGKWQVDLAWTEDTRTLGVCLHHEGFSKANLNLSFPKTYPNEPPKFTYLGPRFDDTVDFVLGADIFEPTKKENWNDTFTCTHLLMIVMELVKDKYPITDDLVLDEFENTLIQICHSRLPGIPKKVKEGMVYFGVRMEPKEKGSKRSSGIGYSNGSRDSHDFSVHDAKFKEQHESMRRFLEMSKDATSVMLARVSHIKFSSWLLQYLEEELPIFKFEEVHEVVRQLVDLVCRIDRDNPEVERIQEVFREREGLICPAEGRLLASTTDRVLAVPDEFEAHNYRSDATVQPSIEVVKRIMLELEHLKDFLKTMTDGQVFVVFSEASCLLWKVLMIPSSGTPYYGGCFEFHLSIPADYPAHPPKCLFMTTGGNQVRFNPNLYNNGKVCLSLLGTWSGEPWDPAHSNLSQLLLSILAFIFTTEPLRNEPGLEGTAERSVSFYNAYVRLESLETAMLQALLKPPTEFTEVIRRHFKQSWASLIRPDLLEWAEKHSYEESEGSASNCNGQIMRMQWFRQAFGAGNYKKAMEALIEKMDAAVDAIKEFETLPAVAEDAAQRGGARAAGESSTTRGGGSSSGAGGPASSSSGGSSSNSA